MSTNRRSPIGQQPRGGVSAENLNFILAVCAILISAASFYATYLQADSAERQVKAMTLPLIQFSHGNYDDRTDAKEISFELKNAGVGPAIIKHVNYRYEGQSYADLEGYLDACCSEAVASFRDIYTNKKQASQDNQDLEEPDIGSWISQPLIDVILPGQSNYQFQTIEYGNSTQQLWERLNDERWKLQLEVCFCSMLDDCYMSAKNGVVEQVDACSMGK
jgi:hypothetical protein